MGIYAGRGAGKVSPEGMSCGGKEEERGEKEAEVKAIHIFEGRVWEREMDESGRLGGGIGWFITIYGRRWAKSRVARRVYGDDTFN